MSLTKVLSEKAVSPSMIAIVTSFDHDISVVMRPDIQVVGTEIAVIGTFVRAVDIAFIDTTGE
jgi:hypothetical protein